MRRPKKTPLLWIVAFVAIFGAGSVLGWERVNDRDFSGSRNLGLRLYGGSITMILEQDGSFDITDGSDLTAVRNALSTINAISTSDAAVVDGGTFDYPANIDSEAGYSWSDQVNRIYFFNVDSNNSFDALAAAVVYYDQYTGLILGSRGWPNRGGCDIAVNDLDYTWSTATPSDPNESLGANTYDIQSVLTHEVQHCFGFEHSAVAGSFDASTGLERDGFTSGDYSYQSNMFPYAGTNIQGRTLEPEDIAAFSDVYPNSTAATSFGQISGRVLRTDGSAVKGAHVVAVSTSDPTRPAVGRLSGIEADTDPGGYRLTGLVPGDYYVRIEPLTGTTNAFTEANTGFIGFDTTFSPEFYSGDDESAVDAAIDTSDAAVVAVVAGATARDIDIVVNSASPAAALNFLPARLAFVGIQGGSNPPEQSFTVRNIGTGSPTWYVSGNPAWLSVSPNSGTLTPDGDVVTIAANLTGLAAGTYTAKLVAQAVGADNSAQAVSVILVVTPSASAIRTVCPSGCDYTTIQGAVDAASSGDTVHVSPGHYLEHIVMKNGVKLLGAGAEQSTIDGGGSGIVVIGASNALLDGFTVTGGSNSTMYNGGFLKGGGIRCISVTDTTISHNVVKYNEIPEQGDMGAGIYVSGGRVSILDNVVRLNAGGYYDSFGGTAAGGDGGGLYFSSVQGRITGNRVLDNLSGSGGGMYVFSGGSTMPAIVTDNLIARNEVVALTFPGATGGGISLGVSSQGAAWITNNTIADNFNSVVVGQVSGIECSLSFDPPTAVTNNIFWGHRTWTGSEYVGMEISGCPTVNYSTVDGGYSGTGNSSADPLFRDRPNYDFHLLSSSPAIDTGTNSAPSIFSYDLAGVPRILDGNDDGPAVADMGAYEYGAPALNPVPTLSSLSPPAKPAGSSTFTLAVNGSDFVSGAVVRWDGSDRTTAFVNASQVTASIPAGDVAAPGTAEVTVLNPVPGGGESDSLTFTITTPQVDLSSTSLDFGNQPVGTTSLSQTVTVTNTGDATLSIDQVSVTGTHAADFALVDDTCSDADVAPAGSCTVGVTFTPTVGGARSATLSIPDNAPGSPHTASLSGNGTVPAVTLSPTGLSFGNQALGTTSAPKTVKLTNTGTAPLVITSIGTSGNYAQTNDCDSPLAPAAFCTISVTFSPPPTVAGGQAGTLSIVDNASGSPHTAPLSGIGVGPVVVLSTTSLNFGNQPVGTTSAAKLVNLSNTGNAPLTITSITPSGDFAQTNNCAGSLAAHSYCTLSVTFTPTTAGTRTGDISIVHDAAGSPHTVNLSGNGTLPAVTLSPTGLSFGNQALGTTSAAKPVKLTNSGLAPLTITSISTSGNYAQTNNCSNPLAAGAYCTIQVTFTPQVVGGQSGTLTIVDNASGSPHTAPLSGIGVGPVVVLSTTTLNFGNQPVGATSAPRLVNLSNTGNASLTITSITPSGDFAQTNNCPGSLAARSYCTLSVTFTPTTSGARTGDISIVDSAAGSPHTVNLSGNGTLPAVTLSPTGLSFGNQALGTTSAAKPVKLTNSGLAPLTITSISTSGNYAQTNNCVSPLAAGAYCTIQVTFTPQVVGGQSGTLTIADNASGSPHTAPLSGVGVGPVVVLSATSLNFGNQPVGTTSAPRLVNLSNTGNAPLTITSITPSGDFSQTNNCVSPLAARSYCTLSVTFTPTTSGVRTGDVTIVDSAAGSPHTVNLSGNGTLPAVTLSPTGLSFGNQALGTTSAAKPVKLTNSGLAPLTISSISTSGNYAQTNNCPGSLAAGAYCTIQVTFTPQVVGGQSGTLTIVDNASGSPHTAPLSGIGVGPVVVLSTTSLNFGNQPVGTTSAAKLVNLSNTGNASLTITSITPSGDFAQTNNCVSPLAARSYCTLSVTFTPTTAGARTGDITIIDSAAGSPHVVSLSGTGISP